MSNDDWQIVPERDEALQRKRSVRPGETAAKRTAEPGAKPAKVKKARGGSSSGAAPWLFILILLSFGVSGYLFYQLQAMVEIQGRVGQRVASLEGRLSVTDESLSESGAAMQALLQDHAAELELHMSEIRKLWGVAYDTNRKSIQDLQNALASIEQQLGTVRTSLQTQESQVAGRVDSLGSELLILSADVEDVLARIRDTRDALNEQERNLNQLQQARLETAEAIDSIDSFRQQFNQRLIQLENTVRAQSTAP